MFEGLPAELKDGALVTPPYFFGRYERGDAARMALDDPFASSGWIGHCRAYANVLGLAGGGLRSRIDDALFEHAPARLWSALRGRRAPAHLAPALRLIARMLRERPRVSVLDVGGGFGDNYWHFGRAAGRSLLRRLDYHVVDNAGNCSLGEQLYRDRTWRPRFRTTLPDERFDVVLVIGTLHYVLDWAEFCKAVAARCARAVYLTRSPLAMNRATFYSIQSICPQYGPYARRQVGLAPIVVLNHDELAERFRGLGMTDLDEAFSSDYSRNFSRLQPQPRVHYIDLMWTR